MISFLFLLIILLLIYLISYLPGRLLMQLFPFDFRVKFAASFGLSFFLYYLASLLAYIHGISYTFEFVFILILFLFLIYYLYKKNNLFILKQEVNLLVIFFLGFVFVISMQGLQPYYSGGGSYWDWFEYYYRSLIFHDRLPAFTGIGNSLLPQRMPLYNAAAAFVMSIFGRDYWVYQIISTLLNLTVLLPCYLLCSFITSAKHKKGDIFVLVISVGLLIPHIIYQITYPWTKALAVYYLLTGLFFILQANREKKVQSIYFAFVFLALGHLVHQVTFPYIGVIILSFFVISIRNKELKHFILALVLHLFILSTWYSWSYYKYGASLAFASAPLFQMTKSFSITEKIDIFAYNIKYTILPLVTERYLNLTYNDKNLIVLFYDRVLVFWGATLPTAVSLSLILSIGYYLFIKLEQIVKNKKLILKVSYSNMLILLVMLSGFLNLWFAFKAENMTGLMLFPVTLLIICFGINVIIRLSENLGKKFVYTFMFLITLESLLGIGTKALIPRFLLDPNTNKSIDMRKDLLSLPEHLRYMVMQYICKITN